MYKHTLILIVLYLMPWGMQCLVNNFMAVYIASLDFASEKTVGNLMAFASAITIISQMVWARIADKSYDKSRVLMWSLIGLALFSALFTIKDLSFPLVCVMIFLFYSCYMVHQTLIDTIAVENARNLKMSFEGIQSFASLEYALVGLIFGMTGQNRPEAIFYYTISLSVISAIASAIMPKNRICCSEKEPKTNDKFVFNKQFVLFLVYTFILFITTSIMSTFFPVYYSSELRGKLDLLSIVISISTLLEWGVMLVFRKMISKMSARSNFFIVAISGLLKSMTIYVTNNPSLVMIAFVFHGVLYGFFWSAATPYIANIIPSRNLTVAQGIWTLTSSGIATAVGSFMGGIIGDCLGLKNLFLVVSLIYVVLCCLTFFLLPKTIIQNK